MTNHNPNSNKTAQVYIIATPIGNKADFSYRAIEILKQVDIIACEDSRTSANLLETYGIDTKLVSYHKFNEKQRTSEFLKLIDEGKTIALISDAGTPCVSDPGRVLVKDFYERGVKITSIPGASAVTTFISMIPRNGEEFAFVGFFPRVKSQQQKLFEKYLSTDLVFYESPQRLIETLENIKAFRGENSQVAVGRELTKMFEETQTGTVQEMIEYYKTHTLKGEIVCLLYSDDSVNEEDMAILENIKKLKSLKYSDKDISHILNVLYGVNKNKVYKLSIATVDASK